MNEIDLKQLPINHDFSQCMRKLRKTSEFLSNRVDL